MIFGLIWVLTDVLSLKAVTQFKKDFKKYRHDDVILDEFEEVVKLLKFRKPPPQKNFDHSLSGNYKGMRECHIRRDTLLIYWINEETNTLYLERMGSHSELFR